ncbi:hypothetical protein Pla52o_20360 [Novipirellula galeiformis]|uniref:Uncharacterized protein n=1 Tax=Novipirellula galeiformis TaxID=2528004 RepID=A0A5C6CIJ2_9BACT|nr:hypothetical protein Pla52o_20360 [Novipirellula galeiformis]
MSRRYAFLADRIPLPESQNQNEPPQRGGDRGNRYRSEAYLTHAPLVNRPLRRETFFGI